MASDHPKHSAHHHASKFTSRQRTIALIIVALAFIMDLLDSTIVNVAIPSIQANLGATYASIQWLTAGYALAFAVLLITGGRMGDVIGYKKMFLFGVVGFTFASLLSGLAWSPEVLIGARLLQGATAALMVPQVMSLMQVMYPPKERGAVMGLFGAMAGLAASLGPIIGGFLIQWNIAGLDWRPIFLINIPVGIIAFFGALKYLPDGKSPHPLKLDILGTLLIIIALSLLIFPLIEGRDLDWPTWVFWSMAASIPFFLVFAWWQNYKEKTDKSPLILPSLFRIKSFNVGILANIVFEMLMLGFFFTFTLMLQIGLGYSVLEAALTGIPTAIGISFAIGFLTQKVVPKLGRYSMTLGTIIMAIGFVILGWTLQHNTLDTQPLWLTPALLLIGTGMGMTMGLIFSVTLKDVDPSHAGSASGTLSAIQQLGGAIGIAAIGVLFFGQLSDHAGTSFDLVAPDIKAAAAKVGAPAPLQDVMAANIRTCYVDRSSQKDPNETPASCKALQNQSADPAAKSVGEAIATATKKANAENFVNAFTIGTLYALILIGVSFSLSFMLPRKIAYDMSH